MVGVPKAVAAALAVTVKDAPVEGLLKNDATVSWAQLIEARERKTMQSIAVNRPAIDVELAEGGGWLWRVTPVVIVMR